jgi:hypothetical protein
VAFPSSHVVPSDFAGFEHRPVPESHVPAVWHWSLAVHVTELPPLQAPDWHVSVCVHAFPSVHVVPSDFAGFEHTPVDVLHVPAVWHWSDAVQATELPPVHAPDWHVSVCVHAFPSLHVVPSDLAGFEHRPVPGLHEPTSWHWSLAVQITPFPPVQVPATHVSVCVHAFPSLQLTPSAFAGFEQTPVPVSHVPTSWHWSLAVHVTAFAPVQVPDWQVSVCVHAFPSLQLTPSAFAGFEHRPVPVLHVPAVWHWSLAVHVTGFAPVQVPVWHVSVCVHAFPSLQLLPSDFAGFEQTPVPVLQVPAVWHWSLAVHVTGFAPVHVPDWQVSV